MTDIISVALWILCIVAAVGLLAGGMLLVIGSVLPKWDPGGGNSWRREEAVARRAGLAVMTTGVVMLLVLGRFMP